MKAKNAQKKEVREEIQQRLSSRGFKIIPKTNKKFWAVKNITLAEIESLIKEITVLMEVIDLDGGQVKPVLTWSYALLNETNAGAAGISIEI